MNQFSAGSGRLAQNRAFQACKGLLYILWIFFVQVKLCSYILTYFISLFISSFSIICTSVRIKSCFALVFCRQEGSQCHLSLLLVINNRILGINIFEVVLTVQWAENICFFLILSVFLVDLFMFRIPSRPHRLARFGQFGDHVMLFLQVPVFGWLHSV
jgi:hypothetical protein